MNRFLLPLVLVALIFVPSCTTQVSGQAELPTANWLFRVHPEGHNVYKFRDGGNCVYIVTHRHTTSQNSPSIAVEQCRDR